jgi:hypothetical protein
MSAPSSSPFHASCSLALVLAMAACGGKPPADPNNREVPWTYGPRTDVATAEHLAGSGHKGATPMAKGWQCRLQDGKQLVVRPYELSSSHPLFGKVALNVGLFDKNGKQLEMLRSGTLTQQNATATFDLAEATAKQLYDLVLWYVKV